LPERPRPEPRAKPGLTEIVSPIITITPEEDGGPAEIPAEEELPKVLNGSIVTRLDNAFIGNGRSLNFTASVWTEGGVAWKTVQATTRIWTGSPMNLGTPVVGPRMMGFTRQDYLSPDFTIPCATQSAGAHIVAHLTARWYNLQGKRGDDTGDVQCAPPPKAHFEMFTESGPNADDPFYEGETLQLDASGGDVNFYGSLSEQGGSPIASYSWGVDGEEFSTATSASTYFYDPGAYSVSLRVTDVEGSWDEAEGTVSVAETDDPGPGTGGGETDPGCWDVYEIWFDQEDNIIASQYLFSYCCDGLGNCYLT